jgi:hypothetical protein
MVSQGWDTEVEMTKEERKAIRWCIAELLADNGKFNEAVSKLCRLVGWKYPAGELDDIEPVSIIDIMKEEAGEG